MKKIYRLIDNDSQMMTDNQLYLLICRKENW